MIRTTITFIVLSEDPIDSHLDLRDIVSETDEGEFVGSYSATVEELTDEQMVAALLDAGSDPSFFNLDES